MYATFISFEFFRLSKLSAPAKFVFTDCSVFHRFCLLFRIAAFAMLNEFLCSINFQKLCAMSRSVKNDCVTSEHVNFFIMHYPSNEFALSLVWRKFSRVKCNDPESGRIQSPCD